MYPIRCINGMLDFIYRWFDELSATGNKQKIQNENICPNQESNRRPLAFQRGASKHSATLTINDKLKLLHYFGISINTCNNWCIDFGVIYIGTDCKNLYFFYHCTCRCYLLVSHLTERCINKPNLYQFHTCVDIQALNSSIVMRAKRQIEYQKYGRGIYDDMSAWEHM